MTLRCRETGYCAAHLRQNGGSWTLPGEAYDELVAAWKRGEAFWEGHGYYGARVTIRLGELIGIEHTTPESNAARRADDRMNERDDAIET